MTAIAPTQKQLTYEEYLAEFHTEPPTRQPYQILNGVVIMSPSPRPIHQRIIFRLGVLLDAFEQTSAIRVFPSPLDVVISEAPLRTRQPDILVMSEARCASAGIMDIEGPVSVAPELVFEVLSPSETRRTIAEKIADYQTIGVQECWLVSSEAETVEVLALSATEIRTVALYGRLQEVQSAVFPDLKILAAKIFER